MINSWNPFKAVWSIAKIYKHADLKVIKPIKEYVRRKLSVKAFVAIPWVVNVWRAPVIDQNSPISGCLEVVYASNLFWFQIKD